MKYIIDKAQGQWPEILESLGINSSFLKNKHGPCPNCGGTDRFRFDNKYGKGTFICNQCGAGHGIKLLQLYFGWSFTEALNMVSQALGEQHNLISSKYIRSNLSKRNLTSQMQQSNKNELEKRRKSMKIVWTQAKPVIVGDPVDCYLRARGIELSYFPTVLRFHSQLPYYNEDGVLINNFPAMLALVQDKENQCVTVHRTYLGDGCKADVPKPKKLMTAITPGASSGAAIKLYEPTHGRLALAEGIETAFCFNIATQLPVWATVSAEGMEKIILPPSVKEIIIAVDNDKSGRGQEAASKLAKRLLTEHRIVKRVMPPNVGQDFNDVLIGGKL